MILMIYIKGECTYNILYQREHKKFSLYHSILFFPELALPFMYLTRI